MISSLLPSVIAVVGAFLIALLFVVFVRQDPSVAFTALLTGGFVGTQNIANTLMKATPLILTGLAFTIASRAGVFNVGAEGQLYLGAFFSTITALSFSELPSLALIPISILVGAFAGALWAIFPTYLKLRFNVNEIISTIMLNYVAILFTSYLVNHPFKAKDAQFSATEMIPDQSFLLRLLPPSRLNIGFLIAIALVILMWLLLFKTIWGYNFRQVGQAPYFSRYVGISLPKTMLSAMALSGGIAGIAGAIEVLGVHHRFLDNFSPGFGFTGIIVSLLGKANPIGDLVGGIFLGGLTQGALMMELNASIGRELVDVIKAVLFISLAAVDAYKPIIYLFSDRKVKAQDA